MTGKRFTEIEHDYENAWIKCNDDGLFMIYSIYEDGTGMPTLGDLLNGFVEENKQLKEQLEICKDARQSYKQDWKACVSYCDTYKDEIHTLKDNTQGLIEENEKLKQQLDDRIKYTHQLEVALKKKGDTE